MTTRRQFLSTSLTAAAALAAPISLSDAHADQPIRKLIVVIAGGGWDTTYAFDPKPGLSTVDVPAGDIVMMNDAPIYSHSSRPGVDELFNAYGSISAVINGVDSRSIVHPNCMRRMLTGTPDESSPDFAAIAGWELGRERPVPYLVLGQNGLPGEHAAIAAQVGFTKQIKALLDPADAYGIAPFVPDAEDEQLISAYLQGRIDRDIARGIGEANELRLQQLLTARDSGERFKGYADKLGARGVSLASRAQSEIAVDALSQGVAFSVAVTDAPQPLGWDTHSNNALQGQYQSDLLSMVRDLIDGLAAAPGEAAGSKLLDETLVAVVSEMGRTPKLNGQQGKDHWPITSALLIGAGVAGGKTYGATTDDVTGHRIDFATGAISEGGEHLYADNLVAGILEHIGVDPALYLPEVMPFRAFMA